MKIRGTIDVGKNGAIVIFSSEEIVLKSVMPCIGDQIDLSALRELFIGYVNTNIHVIIEDVHAIFGASAKSTFNFGWSLGILEGLLSGMGIYPTPAVVVGTVINEKVNWLLVAHVGIIGHDHIMLSVLKSHFSNKAIRKVKKLSVNIIDEKFLVSADHVGIVSGEKNDKATVFAYQTGEARMPVINDSPLVMECKVTDNYETDTFDNFICSITHTYAEESILTESGKIDYTRLKPMLFEMPTYSYLRTGDVIAKCRTLGKEYQQVV